MSKAEMKESTSLQLGAPRFENGKALDFAGLRSRYKTSETMNSIPAQWERFVPYIGKIPGQVGRAAYGACWNSADGIDYLTGVEVSSSSGLPGDFSVITIPAQKYAVFSHREHVSELRETLDAIDKWLPGSGLEAACGSAETPSFFERFPRSSIRGREWAAWRFGYQSNREAN